MTNTRKVQQAEAGLRELESNVPKPKSSSNSKPPPRASPANRTSAGHRRRSAGAFASEYYRQTLSRYREGQALVLELTDAFTQWTNNRLALNAARASRLIRQAELERALAAYTF